VFTLAKSVLKYSLLLVIHPAYLFPHVRYLDPTPSEIIVDRSTPMAQARRNVIERATQPFSLILDADTRIPNQFLTEAHQKLDEGYLACTLSYYPDTQGHPPFGASLWKTPVLKRLYDYHVYVKNYKREYSHTFDEKGNDRYEITNSFQCECRYMYGKLSPQELHVFADLSATHLKGPRQKSFLNATQIKAW
jgi:hypothetical protein